MIKQRLLTIKNNLWLRIRRFFDPRETLYEGLVPIIAEAHLLKSGLRLHPFLIHEVIIDPNMSQLLVRGTREELVNQRKLGTILDVDILADDSIDEHTVAVADKRFGPFQHYFDF